MKFLRPPSRRINHQDALGQSMDAVITLILFGAIGFGLDRWLGTTPWLLLTFAVLASIGVFAKLKYGYDARMEQLEADRIAGNSSRESSPDRDVAPDHEEAPS